MNTRQDVMDDRLSVLEEKLTLLQETLEALPEAISRLLPLIQQQQMQQQQQEPLPAENGSGTELQRRQQYLHPESTYGSAGSAAASASGGNGAGGVSHSKSVPNTWTSPAISSSSATSSYQQPGPSSPHTQPQQPPSKPKLS